MSANNGHKTFLYIVQYENSHCFDVIRSDHDPSAEEVAAALDPDTEFDPLRDRVTRIDEDSIIELPRLTHKL